MESDLGIAGRPEGERPARSLHVLRRERTEFLTRRADHPRLAGWRQIVRQHYSADIRPERVTVARDRVSQIEAVVYPAKTVPRSELNMPASPRRRGESKEAEGATFCTAGVLAAGLWW